MEYSSSGKVQELKLHQLWIEHFPSNSSFTTPKGQTIKINHPGWYNRGWGPDFKDAKVTIGKNTLFGDIEFHVNETDWYHHKHHTDPRYNKVILHIFLLQGSRPAHNSLQQPIENLCLTDNKIDLSVLTDINQPKKLLKETPGACGISIVRQDFKKVEQIIHQAAENRLIKKSELLSQQLSEDIKNNENILFNQISKALGHVADSDLFSQISDNVPYHQLRAFFKQNFRQSRIDFLAIWFELAGVLNSVSPENIHDDIRREYLAVCQKAEQLKPHRQLHSNSKKYPSRPYNKIFRRIIGLYHHLVTTEHDGLLKSWLKVIYQLSDTVTERKRTRAIMELDHLFPTPEWDPFSKLLSLSQAPALNVSRFIGQERQLIILINAVIPFFLAWSRQQNDTQLERKIFAIYMCLPSEGENQKARFMKKRLQTGKRLPFRNILPLTQGLIQIYDDCCSNFYEGCENCSFLKILNSGLESF